MNDQNGEVLDGNTVRTALELLVRLQVNFNEVICKEIFVG